MNTVKALTKMHDDLLSELKVIGSRMADHGHVDHPHTHFSAVMKDNPSWDAVEKHIADAYVPLFGAATASKGARTTVAGVLDERRAWQPARPFRGQSSTRS
jgi:hypothetical protein